MYRGWRQPLMYWDWFFRPWAYLDTPVHFVAWYSCAGFYFGAIFFIIGSFASIAPAVCCLVLNSLLPLQLCSRAESDVLWRRCTTALWWATA